MTGEDIYEVAVCGAVSYWADIHEINSTVFGVEPVEDGEFYATSLPFAALMVAARVVAGGGIANSEITGWVRQAIDNDDPGMIDASCADVILQTAIFGEIVYG